MTTQTDTVPDTFPDPRVTPTMTVEEAARWLGTGRTAAYEATRDGTLPVIRVGKHKLRVPTAAVARMLGLDSEPTERNGAR